MDARNSKPDSIPARFGLKADFVIDVGSGVSSIYFAKADKLLALADPEHSVIVADSLTRAFVPACYPDDRILTVPKGEDAKSPEALIRLWEGFQELGLGRDWTVVGIGGGSVSDLAGFAASTWMRGVNFGFVPTTLLAMVDASVGGKNGINLCGKKNQVGSIAQPGFVLIDTSMLASLGPQELASGMAEALKHGILDGESHLCAIERAVASMDVKTLEAVIRLSVGLKASIVQNDEKESGQRMLLNLGHTFGHALESASSLGHGLCIAVGLACAARLALDYGADGMVSQRICSILTSLGLQNSIDSLVALRAKQGTCTRATLIQKAASALYADKKRNADSINFIMPYAAGDVRIESVAISRLAQFLERAP